MALTAIRLGAMEVSHRLERSCQPMAVQEVLLTGQAETVAPAVAEKCTVRAEMEVMAVVAGQPRVFTIDPLAMAVLMVAAVVELIDTIPPEMEAPTGETEAGILVREALEPIRQAWSWILPGQGLAGQVHPAPRAAVAGAGNYGWDRPITREGLVTVLHNFAQYLGK